MKSWLWSLVVLFAMLLTSCEMTVSPPQIPHHHWQRNVCGGHLFNDEGKEVAAWCHSSDDVQICIFESVGGCEYFDSDERALAYIKNSYTADEGKPKFVIR